jgi:hypothetical protein
MTNGIRILFTLSLLALAPGPGAAQVPAVTEAYVWRGLDAEWGEWTHRLGVMGSYITSVDDGGYAIDVRGQLEGGVFRDPGGASLTTHFTHYTPGDGAAGARFWHLEGDAIELSGAYHCGAGLDATEVGVFRGTVTLGNTSVGGFDPGRIDPRGPTPDQFPHQLALLNGIFIDPRVPNEAHTVDLVHVALDGEPVYHPDSGTLDVPLHVEYRPGCVPPVGQPCSNAVEAPRGAHHWTVEIRPYLLLAAWGDGRIETAGADGAMVDDSELVSCGGVDRVVELERIVPLFAADGGSPPLLGFRGWTVAAGAPDETYADGAKDASCERCAVALRGRHIRQFAFSFGRVGDGSAAVVRGRWQSHPFDGNPYTRGKVNPHWPVWSWNLAGMYLDGDLRDDALIAARRPALSVDQGLRLTATLAETAPTLHALIPAEDGPLTP